MKIQIKAVLDCPTCHGSGRLWENIGERWMNPQQSDCDCAAENCPADVWERIENGEDYEVVPADNFVEQNEN